MTHVTLARTHARTHARSLGRALALTASMFAAATLAACGSDPVGVGGTTAGGEALAVGRFGTSGLTGQSGRQATDTAHVRAVIKDAAAWTTFWASLAPDPKAQGAAPEVDFGQNMVIAAAMPVRPSGGYTVKIEKVTEYADRIEAEVFERSPGAGCAVTMVITRPFDVVQVARRDKPVKFVERSAVNACGPSAKLDTVRVAAGTTVETHGVRVTLRAVPNDSRCPMNANCVWEGDAAVALRFEQNGQSADVTLHTSPKGGVVSTAFGGVEFQLIGLTPYPVSPDAPKPADYTAQLLVR